MLYIKGVTSAKKAWKTLEDRYGLTDDEFNRIGAEKIAASFIFRGQGLLNKYQIDKDTISGRHCPCCLQQYGESGTAWDDSQ